jgi:outer membrane protein
MKIKIIAVASLFFIALQAKSQEFNLNQLLDSAIQNNYLLKSTEKHKLIKQSELEILQTDYLPKVSASASFSYWKFLMPNKEKLLGSAQTDMYTDISVYQTIYDFGQTKVKKNIVDQEILLNDEIIRQMRQTIIWGVADAYFEMLISESEIAVYESTLQQLSEHLKYAENLYKIGKTSSVDILKIKVQISVEEKKLQQSKSAHISKQLTLIQLCNLQSVDNLSLENPTKKWFDKTQNMHHEENISFDSIFINHPGLMPYDIKTEIEGKQKNLLKLENRPELFSYGVASWEHGYIPFGDNFNYNIGVGIQYTLPYWGNSSYKHKIQQSNIVIEQYNEQKQQAFLEIKKETAVCLNTLDEIQNNLKNNREIIKMAEETIKNASVRYQAGQGNIIDILDAQQILTEASIEYDKSVIEYLQTLAKLNYLSGNDDYLF